MTGALTNENLEISVQYLGSSREPLLVIDNFLSEPDALVAQAQRSEEWSDVAGAGYPGKRAGLPSEYARQVLQRLDPIIRARIFDQPSKLDTFECAFSMVTRAPDELQSAQKIPHIDVASEGRVAILHYLCGPQFGGTAFFRQDATGLERVGRKDRAAYLEARRNDLARLSESAGFPDGSTPGYTRTGHVEARFNRLVIYRSFLLHSGIIDAPDRLTDDPATGRLTANFFVNYAATS